MKKRVVAIAILLLASLVNFVEAKEKNKWYVGTKMGWSYFDINKDNFDINKNSFDINKDNKEINFLSEFNGIRDNLTAPIIGVFLGYEFNPYFSLEAENNSIGFVPFTIFSKRKDYTQFNSLQIATKLSYPLTNDLSLYTQLGGSMFWKNLSSKTDLKHTITKDSKLMPIASIGAEYIFNEKFFTRLDYTFKNTVNSVSELSMYPYLGNIDLSFGWKFGSLYEDHDFKYIPKLGNKKYIALTENINFPFNSIELKPVSYDTLDKLNNKIKKMKLKKMSIILSGHSDRIGNKKYNKKLSKDRAYTIKKYLTSRGLSKNLMIVHGLGDSQPLTDKVCKDMDSQPLLISCLAPDRRVEIQVLSKK